MAKTKKPSQTSKPENVSAGGPGGSEGPSGPGGPTDPPRPTRTRAQLMRDRVRRTVMFFYDLQRFRIASLQRAIDPAKNEFLAPEEMQFFERVGGGLEELEAIAYKEITGVLKGVPIYETFLKNQSGCGPGMAGVICASFDIEKADTVSKMWAFSGLSVVVGADGLGHSPKPVKGQKLTYNSWLRSKLVKVLADCFIKVCNKDENGRYYRKVKTEKDDTCKVEGAVKVVIMEYPDGTKEDPMKGESVNKIEHRLYLDPSVIPWRKYYDDQKWRRQNQIVPCMGCDGTGKRARTKKDERGREVEVMEDMVVSVGTDVDPRAVSKTSKITCFNCNGTGKGPWGKALALDTLIPTPAGWSTMGDLKLGDTIFAPDGQSTYVRWCSEVMTERPCMEVLLSDGSRFVCDEEHRWAVTYPNHRSEVKILTAKQISEYRRRDPLSIPVCQPVDLPKVDLPIDPYIMGVWLGDGRSRDGGFTSADSEIVHEFARAGFSPHPQAGSYAFGTIGLTTKLREMEMIEYTSRSEQREGHPKTLSVKYIPDVYLRSSVNQRLALLQGLMDTDGYASSDGRHVEFTTTSPCIRDGFSELTASLGIKATAKEGLAKFDGKVTGPKWRFKFLSDLPVFRLERKLRNQRMHGGGRGQHRHRYIVSVKSIASVPVRCITVSHETGCFLAGLSFVPTHNSGAHRDMDARRKMIKMFLIELYRQWRKLEGLPVRPTYQEEKLGHVHGGGHAAGPIAEKPESSDGEKRVEERQFPTTSERVEIVEPPIAAERAVDIDEAVLDAEVEAELRYGGIEK